MLENILRRRDVLEFIGEVISNPNYSNKKNSVYENYELFYGTTLSLFTFLDALYKYQIIIEVDYYLDEYISQVRKLIKKLNDFNDITDGVNKVIGKMCALKLGLSDREDNLAKEYVVKYIYDKYIINGYVFHGFPSVYKEQFIRNGLIPECYHNLYDKFIEVNKIFKRHGCSVINKNFNDKSVYFTDSFILGCFYAFAGPIYFYRIVGNNDLGINNWDNTAYFKNNYFGCFNNLNLLLKKIRATDNEKKMVIRSCFEEWKSIRTDISEVSIIAVKRRVVNRDYLKNYDEIINNISECELSSSINKIFSSCDNDISVFQKINPCDIRIINISNYKALMDIRKKKLEEDRQNSYNNDRISNAYGRASILMLLGSIFVTLGVIITIIMISKG